ncbi:DUF3576 domain-containing protein [Pelagibacteraceae bacterium]|nr:DUF3576 domain-containing protein [Pelagibacteraceae bacterium]
MHFLIYINKKVFNILFAATLIFFLNSCGIYKPVDARKVPASADERVQKNLEEGKGFTLMGGGSDKNTTYQFASSNPMWRASLDILGFLPLANVDYSGGIITTDWYNDNTGDGESIKITIRFLTNEIRADGLKIIVHKKKCNIQQTCSIKKVSSILESELQVAILKKAAIYEKDELKKKKKK